jgi:hypothetical protein
MAATSFSSLAVKKLAHWCRYMDDTPVAWTEKGRASGFPSTSSQHLCQHKVEEQNKTLSFLDVW